MTNVSNAVRPSLHARIAVPITTQKTPSIIPHSTKVMHCDVVFGSPSMDCNGTGICKITGTNSIRPINLKKDCKLTFGQIASGPNGRVSLFFFREFLCTQLYRQHFYKGVFEIKENCPMPQEISKGLNIKGQNLLPGNYAVVECDGYFRVDVDFS